MFSKTSMHAVKALMYLTELPEGSFAGAAAVAKQIGAPQNYLGKLLQLLARENLVYSQKGLGGGFCLARAAAKISLYDIVNPIDHTNRWTGCILGKPVCRDAHPCAIHHQWKAIREPYLDFLKKTTLQEMLLAS